MTREEYVDFANALKNNYTIDFDKLPEFCDMAISALSFLEREKGTVAERVKQNLSELAQYNADMLKAFNAGKELAEKEMREWIPVTERLPDNNVRVLCSAISTSISGGYTRFVGCCNNGFWFVQTDAETVSYPRQYEVIAWMPLPEPYKGGE